MMSPIQCATASWGAGRNASSGPSTAWPGRRPAMFVIVDRLARLTRHGQQCSLFVPFFGLPLVEPAATIPHADLDAFYASVEQMLNPALKGKPIAVGGGVVLACSYEAKRFGVHGAMSGREAK